MKVAALQHDVVWEDREANFARLAPQIAAAVAAGSRLVVLSEMFSTGFSLDTERVAEPVDGPSAAFLVDQAGKHGVWVCGSAPELAEGATLPHNVLILAGPNGVVHRYRKIHPFSYAREHERYAAGDRLVTVDVEGLRVSLFVCYDLRFADEFWGLAPQTDLFVVVANWPESRRHHWRSLLVARAIENQAYVVGVNRVGEGDGLRYMGDSAIVDPLGELLAGGAGVEALMVAEVDQAQVVAVRERFPFLADRR
ncbi:MAG: carbon-nitrogen family hydrolase [Microthrixaceae bacterium]|nr:carbon-nitrogen family hydrolase [Microthrixaceae bacterium]